jgi:hypothetical protein
MLLLISLMV